MYEHKNCCDFALTALRPECYTEINNTKEFRIEHTDISKDILDTVLRDNVPLDCIWKVEVDENQQVTYFYLKILSFIFIAFSQLINKMPDCVDI